MFAMFRAQGEDKENEESKAEEAPKEMSLEEWKELQEKERAKATFELRKAGEGEKKGMWKDTKVLKKPVEEEGEYGARRVSEHHLVRVWRNSRERMVGGFNLKICLLGHFVHFMPSSARNV